MKASIHLFLATLLALPAMVSGATVSIHWSTSNRVTERGLILLSPGTSADGDGTLLQLGYFSNATLAAPFAGEWTILATGTVGDEGVDQAGLFSIVTLLSAGSFVEPAVGTPLGIRYFDGTTLATSSFYNTGVNEDGSGLWVSPGDPSPVISLTLSKAATVFEDHGSGVFRTTIPVPEPGTSTLCAVSIGALLFRRRVTR